MKWNPSLTAMALGKTVFSVKLQPRGNGLLFGRKSPYVNISLPAAAVGNPTAKPFSHSRNRAIGIVPLPHVSLVFGWRNFAQIAQSVVQPVAIYVVNLSRWPSPISNRKNNPVRLEHHPMDLASTVSSIRNWKSLFSPVVRAKSAIANILPKKAASFFIVTKEFTTNFWCDIGSVSHCAVSLHSGQGRRLFAQLFRPTSYARFTLRSQGELA